MDKMRVYIDFDDVICETGRFFSELAKELFDIDLPYSQVQFFNLQKAFDLDDEQYDTLLIEGHTPKRLLSFEETPGACDTINRWLDEGHDVKVITGRPFDAYEPSRQWLDEHNLKRLPLFCVDKYGRESFNQDCTYSMTLEELYGMEFDFAIEDSPLAFEHVLRFDNCKVAIVNRPWNLEAELPNDDFVRCDNWKDIEAYFRAALGEE